MARQASSKRTRKPQQSSLILNGIRRLVRELRLSGRVSERQLGLSNAQVFVLQKLAESPASSLAELSERTLTDPSSVGVVLAKRVRAGHVRRGVGREDARRGVLMLTVPGRRLSRRSPEPAQTRIL